MLKTTGLALAATLMAGPVLSAEPDMKAEDLADLQCVAVFSAVAGMNPEMADQAAIPVFYYLGRLEGRTPSVDWLNRVQEYGDTVTLGELEGHLQRCTAKVVERGEAMQAAGAAMTGSAQ